MSTEENKAIVRRLVEEVFNKGNLELIPEIYAPNYVYHTPSGEVVRGPEEFSQRVAMFRTSFPDIHMTIDDLFAEGDNVAVRFTVTGTHKGDLMGMPPTGKQVTLNGIVISHFADGKEVEAWEVYDQLTFLQQLGVAPPMGPGGR